MKPLVFAGIIGFLVFAEVPDRYTLVGAAIIIGSTLYIAYREAQLSRLGRSPGTHATRREKRPINCRPSRCS
jgi:drug/metabolite transporter (DMT)-like permease